MAATTTAAGEVGRIERRLEIVSWLRRVGSSYLVRRIFKALFTIFFVTSLTFFVVRLMPGSPIEAYIAQQVGEFGVSYVDAAAQAESLFAINPSEPLYQQYFTYLGRLVQGNLGKSLVSSGAPVSQIILQYLPWTLFSVGLGLIIAFTLGIMLGMVMAYKRESPLDHVLSVFASLFHSIPNYLLAVMIIVFFGVRLGWLPLTKMRGSYSPGINPELSATFVLDALYHAALPIAVYVLTTIGSWMLIMKSSTLAALDEDHVTAAKARGLRDGRITTAYVGRNAILPLFTQLAVAIGFVVGGSLLVERVFQYQGVGLILGNVINQRDYPVMQGIFLVITFSVVVANLLADLLYSRLDPRIRVGAVQE
ncbi:MAG: ABC transporter permease [Chloroflexota bacterium]|nr:ABC transporter permease [Chloroflexota bacterium]